MSDFDSLGLPEELVRASLELGHAQPTQVQAEAIGPALRGRDVLASAPTGSGKTAAFLLPVLARLAASAEAPAGRRPTRALIVAPTRELAAQIGDSVLAHRRFLRAPLRSRVVFGGVSINPQMKALRGGADLVVATPGRLIDLLSKNALTIGEVEVLVLDEADRLLDRGFADELDAITGALPEARQTLLFSATLSGKVEALADKTLRDPVRVRVEADRPLIIQRAIEVDTPRRTQLLRHLLETIESPRVLVFVATRYATEHVARKLEGLGFRAEALHGKRSQGARTAALEGFASGAVRVLVATDVAARGLDVAGVSTVVNYDLPRSPNDYVHRIGRTGRAGQTGVAISFLTADGRNHFRVIEKRHRLRVAREQVEGFEPVEEPSPTTTQGVGGVKGKRKSKKDRLREAAARDNGEG